MRWVGEIGSEIRDRKWTTGRLQVTDDERRKAGSFMRARDFSLKINH